MICVNRLRTRVSYNEQTRIRVIKRSDQLDIGRDRASDTEARIRDRTYLSQKLQAAHRPVLGSTPTRHKIAKHEQRQRPEQKAAQIKGCVRRGKKSDKPKPGRRHSHHGKTHAEPTRECRRKHGEKEEKEEYAVRAAAQRDQYKI